MIRHAAAGALLLSACLPPFDAPRPERRPTESPEICGDRIDEDRDGVALPCTAEEAASASWYGSEPGGWAGDALSGTGPLGGADPDLLVGAKGVAGGAGEAYLVADLAASALAQPLLGATVRWTTSEPCAALGADLAALVGPDGGHEAVAIGAPNAYGACAQAEAVGAVWVVAGDRIRSAPYAMGLEDALAEGDPGVVQYVGTGSGSRLGVSLDAAGDANGDGHDDLLVGGLQIDPEAPGGAWLLLGPFAGPAQRSIQLDAAVSWRGRFPGDQAGCAVAGLGDFGGTGERWAGIGACRGDEGGPEAGEVYLVALSPPIAEALGTSDQITVTGETGDRLGSSLLGAGDLDGDGTDDALVQWHSCGYDFATAPAADCRDRQWGRTGFAALSSADLAPGDAYPVRQHATLSVSVPDLDDHFACNGATSGRFAGDPDALDLAIGICTADADAGTVYLLLDVHPSGQRVVLPEDADALLPLPGSEPGALLGAELGGAGGVRPEARDALLVGAWWADPPTGPDAGAVFLLPSSTFAP